MQKQVERVVWVDLVRIVGAFFVIGIHFNMYFEGKAPLPEIGKELEWYAVSIYSVFFQTAVELFFMVSGFLLLSRTSLGIEGTFKRVARVLLLILSWSVINLLIRKVLYGVDFLGNPVTLYEGVRCILLCKANTNLWFLYALCAIYIVAPILHTIVRHADKKVLRYFIILSFFAVTVYPWICQGLCLLFDVEKVYFQFVLVNSIPMTYFVAGYYFGYKSRFRPLFKHYLGNRGGEIACISGIIGLVVLAALLPGLAMFGHINAGAVIGKVHWIYVITIFLLLKYIGSSQWYIRSMLAKGTVIIAPLTLGVYVMHTFAQHLLSTGLLGFTFDINSIFPAFSIPIGLIVNFTLSALAAYVMLKIPVIRRIVA